MPTVTYAVTVETRADGSNEAMVEAGKYLAYADQTDSFGYLGKVISTDPSLENGTWYITITFKTVMNSADEKAAFEREMGSLSRVERFEEVTNPRV